LNTKLNKKLSKTIKHYRINQPNFTPDQFQSEYNHKERFLYSDKSTFDKTLEIFRKNNNQSLKIVTGLYY